MAAHLLLVLLALAGPARAGDPVAAALERLERAAPLDRGEHALALWAVRLAQDDADAPARWRDSATYFTGGKAALLAALADGPPLPALDPPADVEGLARLLDDPPDEDPLAGVVRLVRFTRGLDRQAALGPTLEALAALRPDDPWVEQARARWSEAQDLLAGIDALFVALGLPVDPRTTPRVTVAGAWCEERWDAEDGEDDGGDDDERARRRYSWRVGAWLVGAAGDEVTLLDDRLRLRTITPGRGPDARPSLAPRDLDVDLLACRLTGDFLCLAPDPLSERGPGAVALRAWWALRAGRPWSAACLALDPAAEVLRANGHASALADVATDLGDASLLAAFVALGDDRPRPPIVAALRGAAAALELAGRPAPLDARAEEARRETLDRVVDLAERLAAQDAALRQAPPVPTWAEWQRLTPAERLPYLLRALPDCDGDPTDTIGFGGGSPWGATQRVPPDAPPPGAAERRLWTFAFGDDDGVRRASGRSAADGLLLLGDVAVPPLIDLLTDRSPTRCVGNDGDEPALLLTLGEVAWQVLCELAGLDWRIVQAYTPPDTADSPTVRQAAARAWWEDCRPHGGLVAWHEARLWTAADPTGGWRPLAALARLGGERAEQIVDAFVRWERDPGRQASWIDALAAAPGDAHLALLLEALEEGADAPAMAAAGVLLGRGDRRGLPRALEVVRRGLAAGADLDEPGFERALWLVARARSPELTDLVFRVTTARLDLAHLGRSGWLLDAANALPEAEALLVLGRLAALHADAHAAERIALRLGRTARGADPTRTMVDALAEALRLRPDDGAREHAAVTAALLGGGALASASARAGVDLRGPLLAALVTDDVPRRHAAEAALERLDADALAWLAQVARGPARAAVDEALTRAADADARVQRRRAGRVVEVTVAPGVPGDVRARAETWRERPLDLALVADLLAAWEDAFAGALEVVIERPASGGVHVRLSPAPGPRPEGPWPLVVEVDLPGLVRRHADASDRCPSERVDVALAGAQAALRDDAAARVTVRAWR